jgi:hypothetical protein
MPGGVWWRKFGRHSAAAYNFTCMEAWVHHKFSFKRISSHRGARLGGISPSQLRITDIRIATIVGAPCLPADQGLHQSGVVGYGKCAMGPVPLRPHAQEPPARRKPCDIDRLFRRIKQFGGHAARRWVSGIEVALWDLAARLWGAHLPDARRQIP